MPRGGSLRRAAGLLVTPGRMHTNREDVMREITAIVALATLACGCPGVTRAATDPERRTETVRFGDLDVTSERGAARLLQRLSSAAGHVCRVPDEDYRPLTRRVRLDCENQAIGAAVAAVAAPAVTALAREHGIEPPDLPAGR